MAGFRFDGIYPMLYAFFDHSGQLDREAMKRQVDACIAAGSHGLAIGGLATECNKLSTAEKHTLSGWVLADTAGRVPVSITVTESTVGGQIDMVKAVAELGADWVVLQPPPVKSASEEQLIEFFGRVADASPIPVGIQNAPQFIGIGLSDAGLIELNRRHPNVSLLKAEGEAVLSGQLAEAAAGAFDLFNGRNGIDLLDTLRAGFAGVIPSPDAVDVEVRIYELYRAGNLEEAEREFKEILPLLGFLMISLEHLTCYGKRLTARRIGVQEVYDRTPAPAPTAFGLEVLQHWSRNLGMLGAG
ncbi:MAG: dihydrodipicolinate synthase family protein [Hyphomicrobiaceae bacterium]